MIETVKKITPNEKQMECIKTLDGTVMVLAGPGTGKTFTIIQRIKHMLNEGISPESILCLTFSDAAASEMKARLIKEMGTKASAVSIHTYHAFCNDIIRQYPNEFELLENTKLIDEITKRNIMKQCVDELLPDFFKTKWGDRYHFIKDLLEAVDEIKKVQISKEDYFNTLETHPQWRGKMNDLELEYAEREKKGKLVKTFLKQFENHKTKMGKAKEAWEIYELYSLKLKQRNFIDFNDMIKLVLDAFEDNSDFLSKVAKKFSYFLVDEYQDTNPSQNQIVFKLAEGASNKNIFVVGDDDQIIYGFQGAQTDNIEFFLKKYPETKVICLDENNRSTQTILDLSYEVISQDSTRLEVNKEFSAYQITKKLTAKNEKISQKDKKVKLYSFADIKQENNFAVEEIEKIINAPYAPKNEDGEVDLSQIAVLAQKNDELKVFADLLKAKNIPFQIKSNKSIFELKPSILIYFYLKALENNSYFADKLFGVLSSEPFLFNSEDYMFLLEQNRLNHCDFITNINNNIERDWAERDKVISFIETFNALKECKAHEPIKNLIVELINRTGILDYFVKSEINRIENILAVKRIIDEAEAFSYLNPTAFSYDFIKHLDMAFEDKIPICIDSDKYTQNAVQLVTLHSSKGREFEYVFIPNLLSKYWENKRIPNSTNLPIIKQKTDEQDEEIKKAEQLKLLFVAITRAKHSLYLSYSATIDGVAQELTSYISTAGKQEELLEIKNHELSREEYSQEIVKSLKKRPVNYEKAFCDELKARLKNFVLSPSSLNSYLNCPRDFLYSNILEIPTFDEERESANYGRAMHQTLEWSIKQAKANNSYPQIEKIKEIFVKKLENQKFSSALKKEEFQNRGIKSLTSYYPYFTETSTERIFGTEYSFDFVPIENYFIKGFIDRVEKNKDGTFALYDYKTGSAKPKSQIAEGKDYESYLNQLRFYKLAFETQNAGAKVAQAGLIFVEESENNHHQKLCDEDNKIIREKIISTYENINNLKFEPSENSEKTCRYCSYKMLCNLDIH